MAVLRGFLSKLVVGKEATWGTAPDTGDTLPFLSEGIEAHRGTIDVKLIRGTLLPTPSEKGLKAVSGSIKGILGYKGYEPILVAAFGDVSTVDNGDGTYTHTITMAADLNKSLTFWIDRGPQIFQITGAKVKTLTISAEAAADGGLVEWEIEIVGKDYSDAASFPATVNPDAGPPYVTIDQAVVKVNGITYYPKTIEVKLDNKLAEDHYAAGGETILEPVRGDFPEITITLGFPRYTDTPQDITVFRSLAENKTSVPVSIEFQKDGNQLILSFANCRVVEPVDPQVDGPGIGEIEITLKAFTNDAVYGDGGTGVQVQLTNTNSTAW